MSEIAKILDRSVETPSPSERVGERLPVHIISGFLGSGKTTAIIKLLQQKTTEEKWAIIINEFGKISIDSQTLTAKSDTGSVYEISGGCICCSAKGYFHENLKKISETAQFDRIIIEPSGLGGIDMVTEIVGSKPELKLMPVICLVDLTTIENPRLQRNFIYKNQISRADWIVFSKSDLLPDAEAQSKFKALFPEKQHFLSAENLTPSLLDLDFLNVKTKNVQFILASNLQSADQNFEEKLFRFDSELLFDAEKLTGFFRQNPSIVRAKGHIQTKSGWKLVNFTLSGCIFETCPPKNRGELVIITEKSDTNPFPDFQERLKTLLI